MAVKVTLVAGLGLELLTLRSIDVGMPSVTVTVVVAGAIVPKEALTVVVQTPLTAFAGVSNPAPLMAPQLVVDELQ